MTRAEIEKKALIRAALTALLLLVVFTWKAQAQTVVTGGSGGATINPTNGLPAVRSNSTTFRDGAAADFTTLFTSCSGIQYLGFDGACHTASGAPAGSSGTVQWNNGGAFGGVTGSLVDNFPDFAGRNSVGIATNNTWTNSDNTHSGHGMEPSVKLQGAGLGNTMAALYATANYNASGGCLHCGPIMGRGTDSGTGGTITNYDLAYFDYNTSGTVTTAVTTLTWLKLAGGSITSNGSYGTICGLCYSLPTLGGTMPAVTLQVLADLPIPSSSDAKLTSHLGIATGGGRDASNYDAAVFDGGKVLFKQAIHQSLTLDSTLQVTPITTGGFSNGGIVTGYYASNFATAAQTAATSNTLLTAPNGFTGTMYGHRTKTDNGGNGTPVLQINYESIIANSGASTITKAIDFRCGAPLNSGATITNHSCLEIPDMAVGTNTNTPRAINQLGATNLNVFAGPIQLSNSFNMGSTLLISNTAPTIAGAGCGGSSASIASNNGTAAFTINVGTAPTSGGCTVTLPTAATGWACQVNDITTNSTSVFLQKQTGGSTTSAVLQNFSDVAVATAPTASDIWRVSCHAY